MSSQGRDRKPRKTSGKDHRCSVKMPNARTIVGSVFAYLVLFLAIKDNIRFVVAFKPGTAGLLVVLCVMGTVEALAWWSAERFGEPGHAWLERSVLIRTIVLPPIAVAAFLWPTGKGSIIALTVAALLLGLARVGLFVVRLLEAWRAAQREERRERRRAQLEAEGLLAMSWPAASEPEVAASTLLEDACRHLIGAALILLACLTIATNVEAIETGDWRSPPAVTKKVTPQRTPPRKLKRRPPEGRQAAPPRAAAGGLNRGRPDMQAAPHIHRTRSPRRRRLCPARRGSAGLRGAPAPGGGPDRQWVCGVAARA